MRTDRGGDAFTGRRRTSFPVPGEGPHGLWLAAALGLGLTLAGPRRRRSEQPPADERPPAERPPEDERPQRDLRVADTVRPPGPVRGLLPGVFTAGPGQGTGPPTSPGRQRRRTLRGTLFRFDSITQIVDFCRRRHDAERVQYGYETGELLLSVDLPGGDGFDSLIVHFEGEGVYAVLLPEP